MISLDQESPKRINAVGEGIELCYDREPPWQSFKGEERSGKEKERHDEEVHDELEPLHVFKERCHHRTERGKEERDEEHREER